MPKFHRVSNINRGYSLKFAQAEKAVDACACAWVEYGVSIRDLSLAESISARNQQAQMREPLANAELPGVIFQPPTNATASNRESANLRRAAVLFCAEMA